MIQKFYEEHLHADEEIRYIIDGAGYEDVNLPCIHLIETYRFGTRMNGGFVVLYLKAISLFFLLVYTTVSQLPQTIIFMQSGCLKIFPSGLQSIEKMVVLFRSGPSTLNELD